MIKLGAHLRSSSRLFHGFGAEQLKAASPDFDSILESTEILLTDDQSSLQLINSEQSEKCIVKPGHSVVYKPEVQS